MKDKFEQIIAESKQVSLTSLERANLRSRIENLTAQGGLSSFARTYKYMLATLGVFVLLGAGVSFAAEGALPGDLLYPVKTAINESIRGAFAVSSESKVKWQAELVGRRLEEAVELEASGKLDMKVKSDIAEEIGEHLKKTEEFANKLEVSGQVNSAIEARAEAELIKVISEEIMTLVTEDEMGGFEMEAGAEAGTEKELEKEIEKELELEITNFRNLSPGDLPQ